jgi:5-methylcytosine-specific restriction endonuclease McrA
MSFDTFDKFVGTPIWDVSSPDMMRKFSWTRLAWCNQRKVAVYLAAVDTENPSYDAPDLGVFVLTPGACVWAHSVQFSQLLMYFETIVRCGCEGIVFAVDEIYEMSEFIDFAVYEMSKFIGLAEMKDRGDATLFEALNVSDPAWVLQAQWIEYQTLRRRYKESVPMFDNLFFRYCSMSNSHDYDCVKTLERLTHQSLVNKDGFFLEDVPALDNIIIDYNETFIKNAEKASEKPVKKPKRTTNVRELLLNSYPHICGLCGEQINSIDEMHVDHIIPLSRGGKDILANLQLTHARCNMDKGNTLFEESEE